ncbi:MAG: hypothetical protein IKK41_06205 [Oscillospiraceae bacterium]|nr:hypothetical protein [Oscillospiraceae bacterium]
MDVGSIRIKITDFVKKYKYAAIILLVGLVLMLLPTGKRVESVPEQNLEQKEEKAQIDKELEQILSQIAGAGEVQVLLSVASGEETVYQTDNRLSQSEENSNTQIDTVTVTDSDRNEKGLIKQTVSPVYRGALIVCEGADSASVRLAIVEAVANITGLKADKISVIKMK